jgi:hypothetical protein
MAGGAIELKGDGLPCALFTCLRRRAEHTCNIVGSEILRLIKAAYQACARRERGHFCRCSVSLAKEFAEEIRIRTKIFCMVYPLLKNETCWFLAADFDKTAWQDDALAFLEACSRREIPAHLEQSRSGLGAHEWFFSTGRPLLPALGRTIVSK